jgi:AcrR family transcriptional regulator
MPGTTPQQPGEPYMAADRRDRGREGSEAMAAPGRAGVARRPRNRRAQILDAAAVLFHRSGFHDVGMEQIAGAVGITAGVLYRHFRSKQELLAEVLISGIGEYEQAALAAGPGLDAVIGALARQVLERRDRGPLWRQLSRDLSAEQYARGRLQLRSLAGIVGEALGSARPGLPGADVDLLSWAALAVLASPQEHSVALPRPHLETLVRQLAMAVCHTSRLPAPYWQSAPPGRVSGDGGGLAPASRRETLLATASRLFGEQGFAAVSMEAIGAAAGIAGPSVYNHFASKTDLLEAVFDRGSQTLQLGLIQALAAATTPEQALELVVRSYVGPTLRPDGLPSLLYSETVHLSADRVQAGRRSQRDYIAEWVRLLPVPAADGRVAVHAALSLINGLALTPHLRARPGYDEEIVGLAMDVLRAADAPRGQGRAAQGRR